MTSLTAGSPSCNCKNPDTCIHSFTLSFSNKAFTYKQNGFVNAINIIDNGGGENVSLMLVGKSCISSNSLCPQGVIYDVDDSKSIKAFNNGLVDYRVKFNNAAKKVSDTTDPIDFFIKYILSKNVIANLPQSVYFLRVGQCGGEPFVNERLSLKDGVSQLLNLAPRDALWSMINIYPNLSWNINATISLDNSIKKYDDYELKQQQKKSNAKAGNRQRGHRGWTKRDKVEISTLLEMNGKLQCTLGNIEENYSASMNKSFKKSYKKIELLNKSLQTIDMISKAFSTKDSASGSIKLLTTDFICPKFEFDGSGELKVDEIENHVYINRTLSIGMAPLIGVRITLDLLQAFAAWYHADTFLAAIRENLESGEENYKEGKDAAYLGTKFHLIVEGDINLTVCLKSSGKDNWHWSSDDSFEAKLSLAIEANIRAGLRLYAVNGAIEIGGSANAEGCLGLDNIKGERLDLVLYHNGVVAKFYVDYTYGTGQGQHRVGDNSDIPDISTDLGSSQPKGEVDKEWIIYDKLEKQNSNYRISIF
ncbi:hypothetical protein [Siccibacter turicensis]|uniref:hypothetical protein n=1 Tax=Siccibacter turicensis TaxID=357233 RepID=UPI0023F4CED3|nr:hypothetical protein [Siccibacter turicensis]